MFLEVRIVDMRAREVLDSRGFPTLETSVTVESPITGKKILGKAMVPSGASTGTREAKELRDNDIRFHGKGVTKAMKNVNVDIREKMLGQNVLDFNAVEKRLLGICDGPQKNFPGANATLSVSLAMVHAAAEALYLPVYRYVGGLRTGKVPTPMMNVINGGAHSKNSLDTQEFMIVPEGAPTFHEGLRWCCEVYHTLKDILNQRGLSTAVGDEGGFAPNLKSEDEVIDILLEAIEKSGYSYGKNKDFMISMDVAASEWKAKDGERGQYKLPKSGQEMSGDQLIDKWVKLCQKYPILSIEDPLDEEDWINWSKLTEKIGKDVMLVGDDLFVTNAERIKKGKSVCAANAVLIKPNQIGTLSETQEAIVEAKQGGYKTIMSHRSGETEDVTIADLSVAYATDYIKTGAPCRAERTAKYNRLMQIEDENSNTTPSGKPL